MRSAKAGQHMREWLSWWSATLPRSRPRVRVPSRAYFKRKGIMQCMIPFLLMRPSRASKLRVTSVPALLRGAGTWVRPSRLAALFLHVSKLRATPFSAFIRGAGTWVRLSRLVMHIFQQPLSSAPTSVPYPLPVQTACGSG